MRMAIIGATGMLGRHALEAAVAAGHEAVAVARNGPRLQALREAGFEARHGDLQDRVSLEDALGDVDAVINCAGYYPTVPRRWKREVAQARREMATFYGACRGLAAGRLGKIVYLGAAIALPKDPDGYPGTEDLSYPGRPRNRNPYLQVKWALDRQAMAAADAGLPVAIAIPTMSFGEYDPGRTTGRFIIEMANGTLPGYVEGRRNVIYAGDAGRGLVSVCERGVVGERYFITGENLTMTELMEKISRITGRPMPKIIPLVGAKLASAFQTARYTYLKGPEPKISSSAIAVMASGQFVCGERAAQSLGYVAQVSVDEAIRRALAWFESQGMVPPH